MQEYIEEFITDKMLEIVEKVRRGIPNEFPPWYVEDYSSCHNCYSHALNICNDGPSIYLPGVITKFAQRADYEIIGCPFWKVYGTERILRAVIIDAEILNRKAVITEMDAPYTTSDAYKIFLCKDEEIGLWHFARESIAEGGKKVFTHKQSWTMPTGILIRDNDYLYSYDSKYLVLATLELSKLK
ncbi:MAG: hypothetical protein HFJ48_01090 [Clostridia bacterium]|nr:hypothetical protein [Clostridia bacterium]